MDVQIITESEIERKWIMACKWFRENLESDSRTLMVTVRQLEILLRVAKDPGMAQSDLATTMGIAAPRVTRNIQVLGSAMERNANGMVVDTGLGLIKQSGDPVDGKKKYIQLTPKGEAVMKGFCAILA